MKECKSCKELKAFSEFYEYSEGHRYIPGSLRPYCKICDNWLRRLRIYGITKEEFEILLSHQEGRCKICTKPFHDKQGVLV